MVMSGVDKYLYMGLILGWGPPVLALQVMSNFWPVQIFHP